MRCPNRPGGSCQSRCPTEMLSLYQLPVKTVLAGQEYRLYTDYRDILEIFSYLNDPELPEFVRWEVALRLFYDRPVAEAQKEEAAGYLTWFLTAGQPEEKPGPRLLDWEADAPAIIADINRVSGREIRDLPYIHWWTFLSWFHAIGEGQLSALVSIREKLARGKKLEGWEKDFYRENKKRVELPKKYSAAERAEQERLTKLLEGSRVVCR